MESSYMISQFDMCRYPVLIRPTCNCCHNDGWTVTITNIILNNQNRPDSPCSEPITGIRSAYIYISFFIVTLPSFHLLWTTNVPTLYEKSLSLCNSAIIWKCLFSILR